MCSSNDICACRPCTYPNGAIVLIIAQILLFSAWLLSFWAAMDCKFVTVPEDQELFVKLNEIALDTDTVQDANKGQKRGLGLFFFEEHATGECAWDVYRDEDSFEAYWDFVGYSDWEDASAAALAAASLAFCAFVWSLLFSCIAHPKIVRYSFAAFVLVVITILQGVPLLLLRSDFCSDHDCSLGRSANYGIAAIVLFFVAGFLMLFTNNYQLYDESAEQTYPQAHQYPSASKDDNATHVVEHNDDAEAPVERSVDEKTAVTNSIIPGANEVPEMADVSLAVDSQATTVEARPY